MDLSKTNEQAFEWLIERSLVGSTREEREAAGQTDVARQQAALIKQLKAQGYEYARGVKDEASLLRNLRQQLEALNEVVFSDSELTGGQILRVSKSAAISSEFLLPNLSSSI